MKNRAIKLKLNALYFIVFGSLACYTPFLTPYFKDRGLSYAQIGTLFAFSSLVSVLAQPIWGIITDKYLNKRKTMLITMTMSGLFVFGYIFSKSFWPILLTILVFMFFQSSIISVCDANTYDLMEQHRDIQYGRIRLMGSVGYACTSLLIGAIIMYTNIEVPFIAYFVYIILGLLIVNTISVNNRRSSRSISYNNILDIVRNKRFIIISISALLANATFSANGNYIAVLIEKTGGDIANLGMLWFILAISELPFFFFEAKIIKKIGVLNIYIIGMLIYIFRFLLDSYSTSYIVVLGAQILQGITFPLFLSSTLRYINDIVPANTRTTALTVFSAISGGLGGFLGNIAGGRLLQSISIFQLYRVMAIVCVLSLIIALGLKIKMRDEKIIV